MWIRRKSGSVELLLLIFMVLFYYYVVCFTYCRSLFRGVVGLVTDPTIQYCYSGFWETVLYMDISVSRCLPRFSRFSFWERSQGFRSPVLFLLGKIPYFRAFSVGHSKIMVGKRRFYSYFSKICRFWQMLEFFVKIYMVRNPYRLLIREAIWFSCPHYFLYGALRRGRTENRFLDS